MRIAAFVLICHALAWAQPSELTVRQAVERAMDRYPSVRVSEEELAAAAAGIALARTSFLPRVDALAQVNRATRNNIFGLLLPQSVIPSISGPVLGANNQTNVFGSALGALITWEPFDFGLRSANVAVAEASRDRASREVKRSQFEIAAQAADAYLTAIAAEQAVKAAQNGVDHAETLQRLVNAQVNAELRPGADASRANAELAAARTLLIRARQAAATARITLAQYCGADSSSAALRSGKLLNMPATTTDDAPSLASAPAAQSQTAAIEESRARLRALDRSYYPRFSAQGSLYGRGTGAHPDGTTGDAASGLTPTRENWAHGFTVYFRLMDYFALRQQKEIQNRRTQAEQQRYQQVMTELEARRSIAKANLDAAREIAAQTPVQLQASQNALQQATARYQAGLSTLVDAADAQRLLAQAEIDDALARLNIWRAMLALAAAQGDLEPFLREAQE